MRHTGKKVTARSQELQQALQAHAQYGYPHLLFKPDSQGTKVGSFFLMFTTPL